MKAFNAPVLNSFDNPITKKTLNEFSPENFLFKIRFLIFINNKSFTLNRSKKMGRIKRKIRRKLVSKNHMID